MTKIHYDIAIIGGGPAGLQTTLILARTQRQIIVFDSQEPPRNSASHGVHNFIGLDGLSPSEIREQAWKQIDRYNSAELRNAHVVNVQAYDDNRFIITDEFGASVTAKHVILALGFRDIHPDIAGFKACWGDSIIACPYCDGYENRNRVWGLVTTSQFLLEHKIKICPNWTTSIKVFLSSEISIEDAFRDTLIKQGITIHTGNIIEVHHTNGKVEAVTLDTGEKVAVGTLWWRPSDAPQPLTEKIITDFKLELDDNGFIKTDENQQTTTKGLWAVGDVRGWAGALGAAYEGSLAAYAISREWFAEPHVGENV